MILKIFPSKVTLKPFSDNTPIDIRLVLKSGRYSVSEMVNLCLPLFVTISHSIVPMPFTCNFLQSPTLTVDT